MMTKRMALEAIVAEMENEDVKAWATAELEKMDAANEARKNKVTPKKQELIDAATKLAAEYFTDEPMTATQVAEVFGGDMKVQKASAIARKAVEMGLATQVDVKVKGKGTVKGYIKA